MKIFNLINDTYLIYNADGTTEEIVKSALESEVNTFNAGIQPVPTDKELLKWAKENHPTVIINKTFSENAGKKQLILDEINKI